MPNSYKNCPTCSACGRRVMSCHKLKHRRPCKYSCEDF